MGNWSKILKNRQKTINYEKQDLTPIGIIAKTKKPPTLQDSINHILNGAYGEEEFARIRGFEYDTNNDEEEWAEDEDFDDNGEDDKGYFISNKPTPEPEKVTITKEEYEQLKSKKGGQDNES